MARADQDRVLAAFPALAALPLSEREPLIRGLERVSLPAGRGVFREGDACRAFVLVLDGTIKVNKTSDSGREIVLYRVEPGQTCVLTTACLMTGTPYGAEGVCESAVEAATLGVSTFQALLNDSPGFRRFVFPPMACA
ncbi:Crp/Fnr family transcriptional regulator [Pararhodospirillum photometricum]|uniref:Cyclic nucleotide-binding:Bacterial regulatory protein, Crp n=1 Tax=Pararhodospirillum photometricum DSM 122 TaxID=1150469 RepID=H6SIV4_PARPM|nr:cyclic nucleotide-binding domain-containing protein [Pararhodospirillum photometricum]CCG06731.1 Cyclic nucleotide-binding:Bacterial regulatory protein, Crp [Pararhodospirillum photometricum DSM 122]